MIYEGVNFNEDAVRAMTKESFVETHLHALWRDRSEEDRRKMLDEVYELTARKPVKVRKRKS